MANDQKPRGDRSRVVTDNQPNSDKLRSAIDSGKTVGKIAGSDPAAAPLGTDDEAGGHKPSVRQVEAALAEKICRPHKNDMSSLAVGIVLVFCVMIAVGAFVVARYYRFN